MINIFFMWVLTLLPSDCQFSTRNLYRTQVYLCIAPRNVFVIRKNGALNQNTDGANCSALHQIGIAFLAVELQDNYNKNKNNDNNNKKGDTALDFVHLCWWVRVRGLLRVTDNYVYSICHYVKSIIRVRSEPGITSWKERKLIGPILNNIIT